MTPIPRVPDAVLKTISLVEYTPKQSCLNFPNVASSSIIILEEVIIMNKSLISAFAFAAVLAGVGCKKNTEQAAAPIDTTSTAMATNETAVPTTTAAPATTAVPATTAASATMNSKTSAAAASM